MLRRTPQFRPKMRGSTASLSRRWCCTTKRDFGCTTPLRKMRRNTISLERSWDSSRNTEGRLHVQWGSRSLEDVTRTWRMAPRMTRGRRRIRGRPGTRSMNDGGMCRLASGTTASMGKVACLSMAVTLMRRLETARSGLTRTGRRSSKAGISSNWVPGQSPTLATRI